MSTPPLPSRRLEVDRDSPRVDISKKKTSAERDFIDATTISRLTSTSRRRLGNATQRGPSVHKRSKVQSCDKCRIGKQRCDRNRPCSNCVMRKIPCTWNQAGPAAAQPRSPSRLELNQAEIVRLRGQVGQLVKALDLTPRRLERFEREAKRLVDLDTSTPTEGTALLPPSQSQEAWRAETKKRVRDEVEREAAGDKIAKLDWSRDGMSKVKLDEDWYNPSIVPTSAAASSTAILRQVDPRKSYYFPPSLTAARHFLSQIDNDDTSRQLHPQRAPPPPPESHWFAPLPPLFLRSTFSKSSVVKAPSRFRCRNNSLDLPAPPPVAPSTSNLAAAVPHKPSLQKDKVKKGSIEHTNRRDFEWATIEVIGSEQPQRSRFPGLSFGQNLTLPTTTTNATLGLTPSSSNNVPINRQVARRAAWVDRTTEAGEGEDLDEREEAEEKVDSRRRRRSRSKEPPSCRIKLPMILDMH